MYLYISNLAIICTFISFSITYLLAPKFIEFFESAGITGKDVQKESKPKIAEMGGPVVLSGFLGGVFIFIAFNIFSNGDSLNLIHLLAAISTMLIITMIGIFDDLGTLLDKRGGKSGFKLFKREGVSRIKKTLLLIPAAIPLIAVNAGVSNMCFPLIGSLDIGIIYPLILIPVAIMGASSAINMLAGVNGLEAGLSGSLLFFLGFFAYINGSYTAAIIAFVMLGSLLAFLKYNWYPADIFPGDSLTYLLGASVATIAIVGNIEKFALICFLPWFIELALKLRSGLSAESFGELKENKVIKPRGEKIHSITHAVMKLGDFKEWQITTIIILLGNLWFLTSYLLVLIGVV